MRPWMTVGIGSRNGAAMTEYAAGLGIFVLAVVLTQVYTVRALNGKIKAGADSIGAQYSSAYSNYNYHQLSYSNRSEVAGENGEARSIALDNEVNARTAYADYFSNKTLSGPGAERLFE